jgi:hypothetical protein
MSSCFLFVTVRDAGQTTERVVTAPLLSFSTGWNRSDSSRYRPPHGLKLKTKARPASWTVAEVKEWLIEEGVAASIVKGFEEAEMDGEALMELPGDDKPLPVGELKNGERLRLKGKLSRLAQYNASLDDDNRLDASGLNLMLTQSSVTSLLQNAMIMGQKLAEVAVVHFCAAGRNGYGQEAVGKTPESFLGQPFYALQMRTVGVSAFNESGSGDSSLCVSVAFSCDNCDVQIHQKGVKDFAALGHALMGLHVGITDKARAKELTVRASSVILLLLLNVLRRWRIPTVSSRRTR